MRGFIADVEFMWGFQAGIAGMSKSPASFLLPPPTTILGAIAEAYARRKGFSECRSYVTMCELAKDLLVLTYKFLNAIPISYQDLNKIIAVKYTSGIYYPSPQDPYGSFDAPARGKTILSTIEDGGPPTLRIFTVFKDSSDITADDLWKIRRIGTKESLVSVINVIEREPEVLKDEDMVIETDYLLPLTDEIKRFLSNRSYFLQVEFVPISKFKRIQCDELARDKLVAERRHIAQQRLEDYIARWYLEGESLRHIIINPLILSPKRKIRLKLPEGYVGYKIGEEVAVGIED